MSTAADQQRQALSLELVPDQNQYSAGAIPTFHVVLRNVGSEPVRMLGYMLDYRLKAAMVAQNKGKGSSYELQPFHTVQWDKPTAEHMLELAPQGELKHALTWNDPWGFAWIQRHSQPPIVTPGYQLKGFPVGSYAFSTALMDQMGIYVGQDGVFDHRLEGRPLPAGIPGHEVWGPVHVKLVEGETVVTFS
jgi:hypothetical protein